ncbi:MAG: hypothetical protein OSJ43_07750 [Oscillospiraceae bacterium]|nr:hypothetical protein [Oscillospiraceae bacterium]
MSKLRLASIIFIAIAAAACIPLTVGIFGHMNTDIITISAGIMLVGLLVSCTCSFIRGICELTKK